MSRRLAALLAASLLALFAGACDGGDDDGDGGGSGSGDVPSGAVATVGDAEISKKDLDTQVRALARAQRGSGGAEPSPEVRKQLQSQALSTLLRRQALEQEAADRGIDVTKAEVRKRWRSASRAQFKTKKALRRFLGGQTEQDLLAQLRLQVLSERVHEQVSEEAGGGKDGAKAVQEFEQDFQERWADRTACRDGYAAAGCG